MAPPDPPSESSELQRIAPFYYLIILIYRYVDPVQSRPDEVARPVAMQTSRRSKHHPTGMTFPTVRQGRAALLCYQGDCEKQET